MIFYEFGCIFISFVFLGNCQLYPYSLEMCVNQHIKSCVMFSISAVWETENKEGWMISRLPGASKLLRGKYAVLVLHVQFLLTSTSEAKGMYSPGTETGGTERLFSKIL